MGRIIFTYKVPKYFMIVTGLWQLPLTGNAMIHKSYKVYSVLMHSMFGMFCTSLMIRFLQLFKEGAEADKLFESLTFAIIFPIMIYKIRIYLVTGIPLLFSQVMDEQEMYLNSDDEDIRRAYLSQARYFTWTISTQIMSTFVSCAMLIVSNIYTKIHTFKPGDVLLFDLWVPFDKSKHDLLRLVFEAYMITMGFHIYVAVVAIPQTLMVFITTQLRILQVRVRKVFLSDDTDTDIKMVNYKVKELIRKHQELIEFVTNLDNGIKNIIMIEYILDSVNVAAGLLHIITIEFISGEMLYSVLYIFAVLSQIFILSWTANDINTQSCNVGDAVYGSLWMDQNSSIKKMMHIMLMRSQKPLAINIGPFTAMNMEASLITLKASYSYASLMIQQYT